jgi:hypothetical protein
MKSLCFFPWFSLDRKFELTQFRLLPFVIGDKSDSEISDNYDDIVNVTKNYKDHSKNPIRSATMFAFAGKSLTDKLADDRLNDFVVYSELISFSGLAMREFFSHGEYSNVESYRLVGQPYRNSSDAPSVQVNRRDGRTLIGYGDDVFQEVCPFHVPILRNGKFDISLLESLVKAYVNSSGCWKQVYDALIAYNGANTDNPIIKAPIEIVLSLGAFERVLGLRGGNGPELVTAFVNALSIVPFAGDLEEKKALKQPVQQCTNIREAWIKDFIAVRNDLAHGKSQPVYPSTWSTDEHLLLTAYIFPLVVKIVLARHNEYSLSDADKNAIFAFDYLLNINEIFRGRDLKNPYSSFPWPDALFQARFGWMAANIKK